jgi:PAT family acetyl-CoA transporter-like MFS transporter 1
VPHSIGVVVPLVVGKFTNGPKPLSVFLIGAPLRLLSGFVLAAVLRHTKTVYAAAHVAAVGEPGGAFWALFLAASALNNVAGALMFVAQMSFFAKISDPAIGGTYMTLLNTVGP